LRDAENGPDFVRDAEKALGGRIEIISGDREAELIYRAARHDSDLGIPAGKEVILVTLDIGGGSTEIVIGQGARIYFRDSLQLGAVRLTERALPSDPPSASELAEAREVAEQTLAAVLDPPSGAVTLVGSGGTIANLAAMELLAEKPGAKISPDVLHGTRLTLRQIETRTESLAKVAPAERRKTPGLEPDRADVIVAGAIIVAAALRRLGVEAVTVSARGLRFGLLYELLSH
jgi:exopolyphosphatase/guanosine-5'-triphosphate,3'-diphosphate pyrophosphatase